MNASTEKSSNPSDTLKARKAHLTALLNIIDTKSGKSTTTETLTIKAVKAEIVLIENKIKKI